MANELHELRDEVRTFAEERDWGKFHTPKNLAASLCVEAAELLEPFQWLSSGNPPELSPGKLEHVRQEMADILIYLVRLADVLDIELVDATRAKLELNRVKYPAEKVRGDSRKYDEYDRNLDI